MSKERDVVDITVRGQAQSAVSRERNDRSSSTDTIQQHVYIAIKDMVMSGRFMPGQAISVRAIINLLGASEMPTREAVKRLTSEGAFQSESNRTTRIPRPNVQEVAQILELRLLLEGLATEQAAKNISLRQIEDLQALQTAIDTATMAGDIKESLSANKMFHFAIYRIADNPTLLRIIEGLWLQMGPFVSLTGELLAHTPAAALKLARDHHLDLLDALIARDSGRAREALQADIFEPTELPSYWQAVKDLSEGREYVLISRRAPPRPLSVNTQ
jgi:DNA-binding GntR family transcriptional regulator